MRGMGKVSRRPGRAHRHASLVRVFRDGDSSVQVSGPVAGDPLDVQAMAVMFESLQAMLRSGHPCNHGVFVDQFGNEVTVRGPIAADPEAIAEALGSIAETLRTQKGPLRGSHVLSHMRCARMWTAYVVAFPSARPEPASVAA